MNAVVGQIGIIIVIFFLVFILGLQIQITALSREIDEMKKDKYR